MSLEFRVSRFEFGARRGRRLLACPTLSTRNPKPETRNLLSAFTLIELLVVVAIMGIILTISVPFMNTAISGNKGMNGAVKMVQEACSTARAWAILQQTTQELRIRPGDGVFEVGASSGGAVARMDRLESKNLAGEEWRMMNEPMAPAAPAKSGGGSFSAKLPEGVVVEGLGVNGEDWTEDAAATVRFYPNGTCDEMSVVLYRAETNERRNVWLEVITGLADIETDPAKFKAR
jgi:prepilin-type N-terminal cleavage/methylation domain-containing protein